MNLREIWDGVGAFPKYAWPGGYPLYYLAADGGILCAGPACANGIESRSAAKDHPDDDQWRIVAYGVHWEGPPLTCDHCGTEIESAYGDPDPDTA